MKDVVVNEIIKELGKNYKSKKENNNNYDW